MCQRFASSLKPLFSKSHRSWPQRRILTVEARWAGRSVTQIQVSVSRCLVRLPPMNLCLTVSSSAQTTRIGLHSVPNDDRSGISHFGRTGRWRVGRALSTCLIRSLDNSRPPRPVGLRLWARLSGHHRSCSLSRRRGLSMNPHHKLSANNVPAPADRLDLSDQIRIIHSPMVPRLQLPQAG